MKVEITSRVIMRIKGDNLSKAPHVVPGTWWEHMWLFFLLTSAYTESWLAAVGIHLTGLVSCGSRKVLPLKARPEQNRNLPRLTQRLVSLTWHSPWGGQFSAAPRIPFSELWLWLGLAGSVLQVMWSGAGWASHISANTPCSLLAARSSALSHKAQFTAPQWKIAAFSS